MCLRIRVFCVGDIYPKILNAIVKTIEHIKLEPKVLEKGILSSEIDNKELADFRITTFATFAKDVEYLLES